MKTLTEISGSLVRTAAAAIADARRSLPKDEKPAQAAVVVAAPQAAEGAVPEAAPQTAEGAVEAAPQPADGAVEAAAQPADGAVEAAAQPADGAVAETVSQTVAVASAPTPPTPPDAAPKPERKADSEVVKAALDEAVAKATGCSGDRLGMLRAAVEAAGRRTEDVRLVRVFGLDEPLSGAQAIGEYQYVLDFFPPKMRQVASGPKDEHGRGGRGGGRGGGKGGGGDRGAKGSATGGFSMDSLRDDRKNERGGSGRPGGGRRSGGGGAARGGGPGSPPGGNPAAGNPKK